MLKLIQDPPANQPTIITPPVIIEPPPVQESTDYQVSVIATAPDVTPVIWAIPLSWKMSGLPRPSLSMSQGVKDWLNYSTLFSNWLHTALSAFLSINQDEMTIPVPDQFIDEPGVTEMTFSRDGAIIKIYA